MKPIPLAIFFLFICYSLPVYTHPLSLNLTAESAILMNADTGAILYQKKPRQKMFPASITKIATAAYALKVKEGDLDTLMTAEQECINSVTEEAKQRSNYTLPSYWMVTGCSHIGIKRGEQLSLRDLLYGLMVVSAGDAANVIAYSIGGDVPTFMQGVNNYLKEIGCQDTCFNNPHGLHHPDHVTTAYDMALVTKEALKNRTFQEIVSTTRYTRPKTNKQAAITLVQTNRLLRQGEFYYPKAIGVKTGRTAKAGNTFVAAAKEGDRTLIAVLLNVKERKDMFREAIQLFETAFNQPKVEKVMLKAGPKDYKVSVPGAPTPVKTYIKEDVAISYYPAEEPKIHAYLRWDTLSLPIMKSQKVGELLLKSEHQQILKAIPLYAQEEIQPNWSYQLKSIFSGNNAKTLLWGGSLLAIMGTFFWIYLRLRAK